MWCPHLRLTYHSSQRPSYADEHPDGSGTLMLSQHSVLVTAGFKLPIMQRSLIHVVSQVSGPCQHIHSSQWPPAMLTWSNGHCSFMLISSHRTWQSHQRGEICGCHPSSVGFHPHRPSLWPRLKSSCLRKGELFICWGWGFTPKTEAVCFSLDV